MATALKIPVIVCEFHQEVLQYIHRLIARKKLPFSGIKMVHFDSHPDLAFPDRLCADDCYRKEKMYYDLDIADWILPLMYAGHIDHLIWVKPPWANQIPDKKLSFAVGKENETGKLRLTCTEDYFLEDCTFAPRSKLTNINDVTVESIELKSLISKVRLEKDGLLKVSPANDCSQSENNLQTNSVASEDTANDCSQCENNVRNETVESPNTEPKLNGDGYSNSNCKSEFANSSSNKRIAVTKEEKMDNNKKKKIPLCDNIQQSLTGSGNTTHILSKEKYILDIDLDFFSVTNPFLQDYTEEQYNGLRKAYTIAFPSCRSDDVILEECVAAARVKLGKLKLTVDSVGTDSDVFETEENSSFIKLLQSLKVERKDIDWEMVHSAGMTTELPHHISSEGEIDHLVAEMVTLLRDLPTPTAITVARSTVDEYCPPQQIELIQEKVLTALETVYSEERLDITYDYNDDSRLL